MAGWPYVVNLVKLITSVCFITQVACESTLTTAVVRESTSPKPSTIYRRINVNRNVELRSKSPIHLFDKDTRRRNVKKSGHKSVDSEIWKWDYYCSLQPQFGTCDKKINRYYYDCQLEVCSPFIYSGCKGNKNNFESKLECERRCLGTTSMMRPDKRRPKICFLQPEIGRCFGYTIQYYFNISAKVCKKFVYGGCGGNANRFRTFYECTKTCKAEAEKLK